MWGGLSYRVSSLALEEFFFRFGDGILHSIEKATQLVQGTPRLAASQRTWSGRGLELVWGSLATERQGKRGKQQRPKKIAIFRRIKKRSSTHLTSMTCLKHSQIIVVSYGVSWGRLYLRCDKEGTEAHNSLGSPQHQIASQRADMNKTYLARA